ncbi:MAG: CotH kinase family protein [Planctomycetes bacterium]|nr:CotH kinase family protein [Planctomycetota bacterium]
MSRIRRPSFFGSWLVATLGITSLGNPALAGIRINEIQSSNLSTIQDENGDSSDWVELYNPDAAAVNLQGWGLSDNAGNPMKWLFGNVTIQPGQKLMVWASSKNRPNGPQIHTSWAISAGGEPIVLSNAGGTLVDSLPSTAIASDLSMGRKPDGTGTLYFFSQPTPGAANTTTGYPTEILAQPVFSVPGGMRTTPATVAITTTAIGGTIRYTLDGSDPTESSTAYTGPITLSSRAGQANGISMIPTNSQAVGPPYYEGWQQPIGEVYKINVLRACVFKPNVLPSRITTQSYLIDPLGVGRYPFPVISISSTSANFFSAETGIYVVGNSNNFYQEGSEWERPGHIEFYETGGALAFQGEIGVRIHGGTTVNRPRKTLRIYARNPTGSAPFNYQIFPDKSVANFKTFLLRNSGNDWGQAIFRDAFVSTLAGPTGIDRQFTRPAVVFLDGEYWGIHNVRDRFDEDYYLNHYGLGETQFTQLEICSCNGSWPSATEGDTALLADFNDILNRAGNNKFASAAGYTALAGRIDIDNYIDYNIMEIWCGNTDWPGNNQRLWRAVTPDNSQGANPRADGRWRWLLYDTDFGLGLDFSYVIGWADGANHNTLAHATAANGSDWSNNEIGTRLLRKSLDNTTFKRKFINRFADLLNTTLSSVNASASLDQYQATYSPGMTEHVNRWRQPTNWSSVLTRIRNYIQQRPAAVRSHIVSKFALSGTANLTVNVDDTAHGTVTINTVALDGSTAGVPANPYPWLGVYFKGVPIPVSAQAKEGFQFDHWSLTNLNGTLTNAFNPTTELTLTGATTLTAYFAPIPCPYDLDGSGEVDGGDIGLVLLDFGPCPGCPTDIDGSGEVDGGDIGLVLLDFGACP